MKKQLTLLATLLLFTGMLTSCGNAKEDVQKPAEDSEKLMIVDTFVSTADISYSAKTLDELYAESDFVGEIEITSTTSSLVDNFGTLSTLADFDVVTVYKGDAGERQLKVSGGYMKLSEYAEKMTWLDFSHYSEDEMENGYICQMTVYTHIPEKGDRLLVFCDMNDDVIYGTSPQQSIYVCDGDTITIGSMETSGSWTDPLALDLEANYGATITPNDETITVTCTRETLISALQK